MTDRQRFAYASGLAACLLASAAVPAQEVAGRAVTPLFVEDFESATIGIPPRTWKIGAPSGAKTTASVERVELVGNGQNKALQLQYSFPEGSSAVPAVDFGPGAFPLPAGMQALSVLVFGDGSKNRFSAVVRDAQGERFEWSAPVEWSNWRDVRFPLEADRATRSPGGNGALDLPLVLETFRVTRAAGGAAKGDLRVDNVVAECIFGEVRTLYDAAAEMPLQGWQARTADGGRALVSTGVLPRSGHEVHALKLEYEYSAAPGSSVELTCSLDTGGAHGVLIADIFGDGSRSVLRFRMRDAAGRVLQGTWGGVVVDWSGWRTVYIDTRSLKPAGAAGAVAPVPAPVRFSGLLVQRCSTADGVPGITTDRAGEIFIGKVQFAPVP